MTTQLQLAAASGGGQIPIDEVRGVPNLVSVYSVYALPAPGPLDCPGVKVGDRVCGGFWYDQTQTSFPISVARGLFIFRGNFGAPTSDIIERVVTVDDQIQQIAPDDFSNFTFTIFTQST